MKFNILTLFPEMFEPLKHSIIERACKQNLININLINIRDFSKDKHKKVDDTPYGGGAGMVVKADVVYDAYNSIQNKNAKVIYLTPQGKTLNQEKVTSLAKEFLNMGQRVVIFTLDPKATCQMVLRGKNLVIYVAPAASPNKFKRALSPFLGRNIRLIKKLFEVNSEKLDVLSVHWTRDYALAARQFLGNIPVFVTVRDIIPYVIKKQKWNIHSYNWAIIYIMNEMVMRNNKYNFIANSEYTAVMVKHYWNRNIPIIPNPILDEYFNLNYTVDKSPQPFVLSTISISAPDDKRKNIHTLLKAFHIV